MVDLNLIFIGFIILIALVFDFTNGMHDAANSIATVVSTRVLSPRLAVIWAAFFNFIAFLIFGTAVAMTIGKGMIDINSVNETVILAGLIGAICWNLITWYLGLPSSSSHALIGGYAGAAIIKSGFGVIIAAGWYKTIIFIVLAPAIGFILGYAFKVASA
jgi:PiT family inorganic phosphate transporter